MSEILSRAEFDYDRDLVPERFAATIEALAEALNRVGFTCGDKVVSIGDDPNGRFDAPLYRTLREKGWIS